MGEYWGATADPNYGYSPYSGQEHYASHPAARTPFTSPPGPGNPLTVEIVAARIRNMHPERMAALADQWQNAWAFMASVRQFVVQQSTVLSDEHWRSPKARDAFLQRGPGEALTYLDVWMDAIQRNVTALRHLVLISQEARTEVDQLVRRYEQEMREAQAIGFVENLGAFLTRGVSWSAAAREDVAEDVAAVTERYRHEAQVLALKYGNQFFDYIAVVANGVGPPVQPVNGTLSGPAAGMLGQLGPAFRTSPVANTPGVNPPAGTPPGLAPPAGVVPPGAVPPGVVPPGAVPPGVVPPGPQKPGPGTVPPGTLPPGSLPPGAAPPGTLPPGALPPGQSLPQPGTAPPGALPPGTPPPGTLPPGAAPGTPPPTTVQPPLPGQFGRGGKPGGATLPPPGSAPPPGRSLRRPTGSGIAPAAPGGPVSGRSGAPAGGRSGAPSGGREIRRGGTGSAPSAAPPPQNRRAGKRGSEPMPGTALGRTPDGAPDRAPGAAPPVLSRPVPPDAPAVPPAVLGRPAAPAVPPPRPRRALPGSASAPAWSDWFGAEKARAGAGAETIGAPRRSRPESEPTALRSPASAPQPGADPAELSKRHVGEEAVAEREDGEIVTDEQAFGVRSPGGGVVKRGE
jgi:hypothetical protein